MPYRRQRDPLTWLVAGSTTAVWTMTAFASIVTGDFRLFEIATAPYLLVVGWITGVKVLRNNGEK